MLLQTQHILPCYCESAEINMIKVREIMQLVFHLMAFVIAGLLSYLQYQNYAKNHDISSVTYRGFNTERKDVYPSFSVCLYSSFGMIFKQDKNILGLKGWKGGHLYRKMLRGEENIVFQFRLIHFDEVAINLLDDIIHTFRAVTKQGSIVDEWNKSSSRNVRPLVHSYQDPNQICITRERKYAKGLILNYEVLSLDAEQLYNITADLHIYIHRPGELTRILHKPILSFSFNDFKEMAQNPPTNNHFKFHINHVEIMRDRPDANPLCNVTLLDDDAQFRTVIIRKVGCVPSYWKRFLPQSTNPNILNWSDCVYQNQLHQITMFYLPDLNVANATRLYLDPCNKMKTIISTTTSSVSDRQKLVLQFDHLNEEYKVSQNNRIRRIMIVTHLLWINLIFNLLL